MFKLEKCGKLAQFESVEEPHDHVGNATWSDMQYSTLSEKLDYWNSQYMALTCEHSKMQTLVKEK